MKLRVADALVLALRDYGTRYFFSVSGANIEAVHDAIYLHGKGRLLSILAKHESGAGFMADCHARAYGTLGLCGSTSGGGMVNLLAGIAEANQESVPLLALVGQPPRDLWGRGAFQDSSGLGRTVNAKEMFRHAAKYVGMVDSPEAMMPELRRAVDAAVNGRPGASVLLLPRDVQLAPFPEDDEPTLEIERRPEPADGADVERFVELLRASSKPVFLLGQGVLRSDQPARVAELARRCRVPVVVSTSGKGAFPNDDPLYRGCLGLSGNPSAVEAIAESDLVVAIGVGMNLMTRAPVGDALSGCRLVYANVDDGYVDAIAEPTLKLIGDAGRIATAALDRIGPEDRRWETKATQVTELEPWRPDPSQVSDNGSRRRLTMYEAMLTLRKVMPPGANLVVDAGNAGATACHLLPCPTEGKFLTALGMGGMGYAIAGAVGAALPFDDEDPAPTIVVAGDGALLMNGSEINTIVSYRLPICLVVLNNSSHAMCVTRQQIYFESRYEAVRYPAVDVASFARSLAGGEPLLAASVDTAEELAAVVRHSVERGVPSVVDVRVSEEEVPPFLPFRND